MTAVLPTASRERRRAFGSLSALLAAHAISQTGNVITTFAIPFYVLGLGGSGVEVGIAAFFSTLPIVVGGALVVRAPEAVGAVLDPHTDEPLADRLAYHQNAMGAVSGPFDAFLTLRGLKTLAVRMERHSATATRVAEFLDGHDAVSQVLYPGLPQHSGHEVAARQMRGFGGMVSFRLARGRDAALKTCASTSVFILAESLGGVESLIEHPQNMTLISAEGSELVPPADLVRISVGIESIGDLLADLKQALDALH